MSLKSMVVTPPSLMVAQKSTRTLYIVLDPEKVPSQMPVLVQGEDRGGKIVDVEEFVQRDLKKAMSTYFESVEVVAPNSIQDTGPYALMDVKLDRIEVVTASSRKSGIMKYTSGSALLTWGVGLRMSESNEYMYSFAGEAPGMPTENPTFAFRSMFENAITGLLKSYTDKETHQKIMSLPAPKKPGTNTL